MPKLKLRTTRDELTNKYRIWVEGLTDPLGCAFDARIKEPAGLGFLWELWVAERTLHELGTKRHYRTRAFELPTKKEASAALQKIRERFKTHPSAKASKGKRLNNGKPPKK